MPKATRVIISGPLSTNRGSEIVHQAVIASVTQMLEMGEQRLDQVLRPRPGGVYLSASLAGRGRASTGNYRRHVHGVQSDLFARIDDGGVVYGPWLEGIGSRNATTRFKGYQMFRKTAQWLRGQLKQVAKIHMRRAVAELRRTS